MTIKNGTAVGKASCLDDAVKAGSKNVLSSSRSGLPLNTKLGETSISKTQKPKRRVRQSECQCPYCLEEGGNKTKGPNGKPLHICHVPHCRKIFGYARSLYRHQKLHSGEKNFVCPDCSKEFARKDSLKIHMVTHRTDSQKKGRWVKCPCANCIKGGKKTECLEKEYKYVCEFPGCGKAYVQAINLKYHRQFHSNKIVRNFTCDHCNSAFARKDKLRWHLNIHMNEGRKWTRCGCPHCIVDGHIKIRAINGKLQHIFPIPGCGNELSCSWQLKRHMESHSGKKNYFCPYCNKGFARLDSFDRHVKNHNNFKRKKVNGLLKK